MLPYHKPGSTEIANDLFSCGSNHKAFLLANHGMVVGGKNAIDALNNAQELEESCHLFFTTKNTDLRYLTEEEIFELRK